MRKTCSICTVKLLVLPYILKVDLLSPTYKMWWLLWMLSLCALDLLSSLSSLFTSAYIVLVMQQSLDQDEVDKIGSTMTNAVRKCCGTAGRSPSWHTTPTLRSASIRSLTLLIIAKELPCCAGKLIFGRKQRIIRVLSMEVKEMNEIVQSCHY